MCVTQDAALLKKLKDHYKEAGKKLDTGKSCLRFRSLDDLPLDVIGEIVAGVPPDALIARYETAKGIGKKRSSRPEAGFTGTDRRDPPKPEPHPAI